VICGEGHLWAVYHRTEYKVVDLKYILSTKYKTIRKNGYPEYSFRIPVTKPVEFKERDLSIDPYFLGIWLGDGHSHCSTITTADNEIVDYLHNYANKLGHKVNKLKSNTRGLASSYSIGNGHSGGIKSTIL